MFEYPDWQQSARLSLEEIRADAKVAEVVEVLRRTRGRERREKTQRRTARPSGQQIPHNPFIEKRSPGGH